MSMIDITSAKLGDEVFVIYRNPHVPTVANIKAAEIVQHPKNPNSLALFPNETFHVIEDDDALFSTSEALKELSRITSSILVYNKRLSNSRDSLYVKISD